MRHEKPPAVEVSLAVYRWLLRAYPPAFRERYGDEMARVFRDTARDALRDRGLPGLLALWGHTLRDTLKNASRERVGACQIGLFGRRALALFSDRLTTFVIFFWLNGLSFIPGLGWVDNLRVSLWSWSGEMNMFLPLGFMTMFGLPRLDFALIIAGWVVYMIARYGRTPGMEACGLRVLDVSGAPVRWPRILLWHLASYLSGLALGAGYLWALLDPEGRTWHDIFAGVRVHRVPEEVEPALGS